MNINFSGKRALVTGAANGIGKGVVKRLAEYGAQVVAFDIDGRGLLDLKNELPGIETHVIDISNWEATRTLIAKLEPFDLLVNNAGIVVAKLIGDITEEDVDRQLSINVKAIVNITQEVSKAMIAQKKAGCSIVNLSSQLSKMALRTRLIYGATKAAVDQITKISALELGQHQIRVNAVNPTVVWTDLGKRLWSDPQKSQPMLDRIMLHRFSEVKDVVDTIVYLLSDKSDMITGACIPIDGGATAC